MIVLDAIFMALITAVIVGFLTWSICTQHRDAGCAHLRIRRRLQIRVRLVTLDKPELVRETRVASQIRSHARPAGSALQMFPDRPHGQRMDWV